MPCTTTAYATLVRWRGNLNSFPWPSGEVNAMQKLFQGSTDVAANLCVIGITPVMLSSLMMSAIQAMAKVRVGDYEPFPVLSRYFTQSNTDPFIRMDVQVLGNYLLLFLVSVMVRPMFAQPTLLSPIHKSWHSACVFFWMYPGNERLMLPSEDGFASGWRYASVLTALNIREAISMPVLSA